jgi:hypothetical protein
MNDNELVVAIIVGLVILALVIKFWRVVFGLGVIGAVIIGVLCSSGEIDCPIGNGPSGGVGGQGGGGGSFRSSNSDIIYSVYQHLRGKTYIDYETVYRKSQVPCSQIDYDTDWGKGDPHAGKCRGTGGYGYGYKTENRPERVQVNRLCPNPPSANSAVWHVQQTGRDRWIVSNPQGRWTVEQAGSGFHITPHQKC